MLCVAFHMTLPIFYQNHGLGAAVQQRMFLSFLNIFRVILGPSYLKYRLMHVYSLCRQRTEAGIDFTAVILKFY